MDLEETLILPGAEPYLFAGNSVGVLISHGFTGTTQSTRYVGEQLHRLGGFTVLGPRLAGHGVSPEAMAQTNAGDWVTSIDGALAELRARCSQVFMAGLSMGGCLSLLAAARHPDLRGIVPINACLYFDAPDLAALAYNSAAPEFISGVGSDIKQSGVREVAYPKFPVSSIHEIYGLMAVTRELLPRVVCPVLVLQSTEDHLVPPSNGDFILEHVGAADRTLVRLENSYHVATLDNDKDLIVTRTLEFINRIATA